MTNNKLALTHLLTVLKKAEKAGPGLRYSVTDSYGDGYDVSEQDFNDAEIIEVYDSGEFSDLNDDLGSALDDQEGEFDTQNEEQHFVSYSAAQLKAIKTSIKAITDALKPQKLYYVYDSGESVDLYLTEAQYKAIKAQKQGDLAFRFSTNNYAVEVHADRLKIGCQEHSLDYWRKNLRTVAAGNLYCAEALEAAVTSFHTALPYLERMTERLQSKTKRKAKKQAKKQAKK